MPLRLSAAALLAALALSVPAPAPAQAGEPTPASITYSVSQCYGECPAYTVTVRSDGTGTFTGGHFTAVTGQREFAVSRQQFAAFADMLAPHRPEGREQIVQGHPRCSIAATDMPSAEVSWNDADGPDSLLYYSGCRGPGNGALLQALREAPEILPIWDFIGLPDVTLVPR